MNLIEGYYVYGLYPLIRQIGDQISRWIPVPIILIVFFILLVLICILLFRRFLLGVRWGWKKTIWRFIGLSCLFIAGFYFLWGLVYSRTPFEQLSGLERNTLQDSRTKLAIDQQSIYLNDLRASLSFQQDGNINFPSFFEKTQIELISSDLKQAFSILNLKPVGSPIIKSFKPAGFLLRLGTAGFYFPYGFEGYVDPALHPIQHPFTIAHELAHGMGIPGEGECNFLAWLACSRSKDPFYRYSAAVVYWKYLASEVRQTDSLYVRVKLESLSPFVLTDFKEIREASDRYPDWFPAARDAFYTWYLNINGIPEGEKSYSTMLGYIDDWKRKNADIIPENSSDQ